MIRRSALLLTGLVLAGAAPLFSQEQRIAFVDTEQVLDRLPEYSGIEQTLRVLSESWRDEIDEMDAGIREMQEEFDTREILLTDEMRNRMAVEIEEMILDRDRYANEKFGPDGEYFLRQKELLEPIQRRVYEAIQRVADRDGYDFVFDRAGDVKLIFARPEWNLSREVMIELGVDPDGAGN